jgi:hypothetical protein
LSSERRESEPWEAKEALAKAAGPVIPVARVVGKAGQMEEE